MKANEYEEILKYEIRSVYEGVNAWGNRSLGFFWEMRGVNGVMNVE